jgi:hypothetical protein
MTKPVAFARAIGALVEAAGHRAPLAVAPTGALPNARARRRDRNIDEPPARSLAGQPAPAAL